MENRLDTYLVNNKILPSRTKAQELIKNGKVLVNDKAIFKASYEVSLNDNVKVLEDKLLTYVSRGGLKLEKALEQFKIDVNNYICVDIGSSTGGFTDCLLKHGASKIYAIDVGTNQLDEKLRANNKVISIENTNFKDVEPSLFESKIDLYVCDVSFISINNIIDKLDLLDPNFRIIILFKPQFEVGPNNINKNGVVKSKEIVITYLKRFVDYLKIKHINICNFTYSPITGQKEGNIEYLFELSKEKENKNINIETVVNQSYKELKVK